MAEELIISVSGMRGVIGRNLTAGIAAEYGCAFGTFLKRRFEGKKERPAVCIGRDSRPSGQMLCCAVTSGLCSVGIDVIDIGIVTTPAVGIMLRQLKCAGGVVISASHNPMQYNGIKLLLDNGVAPERTSSEKIKLYYFGKGFDFVGSVDCGKVSFDGRACSVHIDKVLSLIDSQAIAAKKYKVVLDSVNGAGGLEGKMLLSKLGSEIIAINDEPTGIFAHQPEPLKENLKGLCERVKKENADIGFAQDPDADRLAIVDENGRYIGEEYTLALAVKYILSKRKGSVATNLSTSRMIDDIAREAGVKVFRTPVGEANVAAVMLENSCVIGGEGNGGVIDLRAGPIRDSLVGIAFVLQLMAETGKRVSELVSEIEPYYISKDKFSASRSEYEEILKKAREVFFEAGVNTTDGCRFDFEEGWLHIRASNTEPVVRFIVEAKDKQTAQKYIDTIADIRQSISRQE